MKLNKENLMMLFEVTHKTATLFFLILLIAYIIRPNHPNGMTECQATLPNGTVIQPGLYGATTESCNYLNTCQKTDCPPCLYARPFGIT